MKVYVLTESGYYNEEYWDMYTEVLGVYTSREKAVEAVDKYSLKHYSIKPAYDEERDFYYIGNEDDCYDYRMFNIEEETLDD